jgi:metal-responsive CopG/Arc/MetJ family transcriptional regulator
MAQKGRPRGEKRAKFASTIRQDLMDRLRELSDETGINQNKLLDNAIDLYIKSHDREEERQNNDQLIITVDVESWIYTNLMFKAKLANKDFNDLIKEILMEYIVEKDKENKS